MAKLTDIDSKITPSEIRDYLENKAKEVEREKYTGVLPSLAAGGLGALRGASFSLSDIALDKTGLVSKEAQEKLAEYNPAESVGGEVVGIGASLLIPGTPVARVAQIGTKVQGRTLAALGSVGAKNLAARALAKGTAAAAGSAVEGAFYGLGQGIKEEALGDSETNGQALFANVGLGSLYGGAGGLLFGTMQKAAPLLAQKVTGKIADKADIKKLVDQYAGSFAVRSLGSSKREIKKALRYNDIDEFSKFLFDNNIIQIGDTYESIAQKLSAKQVETGTKIGNILSTLDDVALKQAEPEKFLVNRDEIISKVYDEIIAPMNKSSSKRSAAKVLDTWLEDFKAANPENLISLSKANQEAADLSNKINFYSQTDKPAQEAFRDTRKLLKNVISEKIESASENLKPELKGQWKPLQKEYSQIKSAESIVSESLDRIQANRLISPTDYGLGIGSAAVGALAGGPLTGLATGLAGAAINKGLRTYGPAATASTLNAISRGLSAAEKANVLGTMERSILRTNSKINKAVNGLFSEDKFVKTAVPVSVNFLLESRLSKKKNENRMGALAKDLETISQYASNPGVLAEKIAEQTGMIAEAAPMITQSFTDTAVRAAEFLAEKAPKRPEMDMLLAHPWTVDDQNMAKFERYMKAVEDPMSVVEDLARRQLAPEGVEAISRVYPSLYSAIRTNLAEKLTTHKERLDYQTRLQLSQFFQIPLESSVKPASISALQSQFQGQQNLPSRQGKPLKLSPRQTMSQSAEFN